MVSIYLPRHDTQFEPRTSMSGLNCNMAAAADAARFWSLGLKDRNHQWYRDHAQNPDGSRDRSGGTNIAQAQEVLDDIGVPSTLYDSLDGRNFGHVRTSLKGGRTIIAHGDYGSVPRAERGEISPNFTGLHSVYFARWSATHGVQVGDGLSDRYEWWSEAVASKYMRDFPGGGYTYLVITPRRLKARVPRANVRKTASISAAVIGQITPRSSVHYGGVVVGGSVGSNRNWYRVYFKGQIGYVHTSVGTPR